MGSATAGGYASEADSPGGELPEMPSIAAPRKLAEDAAEILRAQILAGNLRRGTHLVEAKLAALLNVSRGTVREALRLLAAEGLVVEESRRGAFVATLEPVDVREIYDLRAAIEGRAAYLLAARRDQGVIDQLRHAIDAIAQAARDRDLREVRRLDLAFHEQLCALTGNGRLQDVFVRYVPVVQTLLTYDHLVYSPIDDVAGQHQPILDAIDSGDAEAAARAVVRHCEESRDKVSAYFEDHQAD
jgi:GntR family transcriptional regulator of gluconate operon